ncbi:MAG: GAF domain-containing protein [Acidimicrobiia bacterium]|nr:GAF domain-containing protein [Acidimicrobiia bacterium]
MTAIEALLVDLARALESCEARIFLLDAQTGRLTQALRPPGADPIGGFSWKVGQGVTGWAYDTGDYVLATGSSVHDGTFGVPVEQQDRYRSLTAVAGAPLRSTAGEIIGVLSISSEQETTQLPTNAGEVEHLVLAECVGFALDELMGLDPDVE